MTLNCSSRVSGANCFGKRNLQGLTCTADEVVPCAFGAIKLSSPKTMGLSEACAAVPSRAAPDAPAAAESHPRRVIEETGVWGIS